MSKLQSLKRLWNYAFNNNVVKQAGNFLKDNKVINYASKTKAGKATKELIWDANVAAFGFFKGAKDANRYVNMLQRFSNRKLSIFERAKYGTKFFIKGREMHSIYKDPAKAGAIIGRFVPMVGTTQAGYLLGKGLNKGAKVARDFVKRTQNVLI